MPHFTKTGQGQPLILIHGFCESKEIWFEMAEALAATHTVFAIDLPGFGDNPLPKKEISMESLAADMADWMEKERIESPIVIGHSLGGYVTLALAELLGPRLKGIGLFHSTALPDDAEKKHTRNKVIAFLEKNGIDPFLESFVPGLFAPSKAVHLESRIQWLIQEGKRSSTAALIAYTAAMRDRKDRLDVWKHFLGKKLLISGRLDTAVKIENSRQLQPFADIYLELEDAAHMGMFEEPEKSLEAIREFLDSLTLS
ncbi:Alpha/beta hydrolase fold protein [Mariniradius saccharolyticus AK6]|uniref:Alpha/beta hydrolase fold protein n=1 Tax=Mariniradius saccharolyticus AK6 TaxID=1239962 RepID=M7Y1Y6_9BACT|nr:alpha/beta hydrolase [Mariniradius saccharolyticus]EMS34752.1 Alpha/beta hydrolase fold protein [Mariniradius saccharolyticus AK6]